MARRLGVSRQDVIDAAVRLSDSDGLSALTVAAVADAVGCRPPSIYHHVDGLDGLSRAVALVAAEDAHAALSAATAGTTGMATLTALVEASRAWGAAHPNRQEAMRYVDPGSDPELAAARGRVMLLFQDAVAGLGIPAGQRPPLVAMLIAAVRGSVDALHESRRHDEPELAEAWSAGHDLLVELALEHLAEVTARVRAE